MKRVFLALTVLAMSLSATAQTYTNNYKPELQKIAQKWAKKGEWKHGFTKAKPSDRVNLVEFYLQYQKNPAQWKALMQWLENNDLLAVPAGRIPIEGTNLTVSVEDSENWCTEENMREGKGSESHEKKIDFMFVVRGKEGFARLDHESSEDKGYNAQKDRHEYRFAADKLERFESQEGTFELMFPCDWHIAKVRTKDANQKLRVLVVKMDYAM